MNRSQIITAYVSLNRRFEKKYFPLVKKAIQSKVSSLILKVKEDGVDAAKKYLHLDLGNMQLRKVVSDLYGEVGLRHARVSEIQLRNDVRKEVSSHIEIKAFSSAKEWADFIQNYLKHFLLDKITFKVNETTRDALLRVLDDAINNGWGVDETVKHLEDLNLSDYQAARIVRTEINRASNVGVYAQGASFQYELQKEWIAIKDNRTRGNPSTGRDDHSDHWDLNGQLVDFFDVFRDPRSGAELNFPGDPNANADETINCRCVMGKRAKRDENGRLMERTSSASIIMPGQINRPETITI